MRTFQRGFTLIELMIVIAIIGILAAIAIPAYQDYTIRSEVSEGAVLADGMKTAIVEFYNNNGRWPTTQASAGLEATGSIVGKYVTSVDVATTTGKVIVTFGNQVNTRVSGSILTFSAGASLTQGSITWNCKNTQTGANGTTVVNKYLPSACRT